MMFFVKRFSLFLLIFLLFPSAASAASVQLEPKRSSITLGEKTRLILSVKGEGELQLQANPFPYGEWADEGEEFSSEVETVPVQPRRNTRYRILLLVDDKTEAVSSPKKVFVQPRSRIVSRWNRPYLFARGWTEVDGFYHSLYKKLPARQKQIYLYTRCSGGSWKKSGQSPLRAVSLRDNIRFDWSVSRALPCRGRLQYWNVGMLLFPGTLPSGDEGLGRPSLNLREIKAAVALLGQKTISPRDMKRYFGA